MIIRNIEYFYVLFTVVATVYGQIVIKWQVGLAGPMPAAALDKAEFLVRLVFKPWVISSYAAALVASLTWMAALGKLPLSVAYPFVSLTFVLVMVASAVIFSEPLTISRLIGSAMIIAGITLASRG